MRVATTQTVPKHRAILVFVEIDDLGCVSGLGQPRHDPRVTVVFHEGDDGVTELAKVVGLASVAPPVIGYLLSPPLAIPLGFDVAARAPVPETAVHENGDSVVGEHQVGLAREVSRPRRMPDTQLSRDSPHTSLGLRVSRRDLAHPCRHRSGRLKRLLVIGHAITVRAEIRWPANRQVSCLRGQPGLRDPLGDYAYVMMLPQFGQRVLDA